MGFLIEEITKDSVLFYHVGNDFKHFVKLIIHRFKKFCFENLLLACQSLYSAAKHGILTIVYET